METFIPTMWGFRGTARTKKNHQESQPSSTGKIIVSDGKKAALLEFHDLA
jgi:hypothetical protein